MSKLSMILCLTMTMLLSAGCKEERAAEKPKSEDRLGRYDEEDEDVTPDEGEVAPELIVLCGNSFVIPTEELIGEFRLDHDIQVVTTAAESETFLPLVKAGKRGDILVTHDPYLDAVEDANSLGKHVAVGYLAPVVAVQKGNPKNIQSIDDLAKADLKVALSDPQYSTCGQMVEAMLKDKGIYDKVMANVGNRLTKGHAALGSMVETGAVDAVMMWNGVAHTFAEDIDVVPTDYEYEQEVRIHIMGLNYSEYEKEVNQFIDFAEANGDKLFAKHGYTKKP